MGCIIGTDARPSCGIRLKSGRRAHPCPTCLRGMTDRAKTLRMRVFTMKTNPAIAVSGSVPAPPGRPAPSFGTRPAGIGRTSDKKILVKPPAGV